MVPYEQLGGGYQDVLRRVPDPAKAQRLLGFKAEVPLDEGLRTTIAWQRAVYEAAQRPA
jgi:nucleoside-diphosphate-sugar epimerase